MRHELTAMISTCGGFEDVRRSLRFHTVFDYFMVKVKAFVIHRDQAARDPGKAAERETNRSACCTLDSYSVVTLVLRLD